MNIDIRLRAWHPRTQRMIKWELLCQVLRGERIAVSDNVKFDWGKAKGGVEDTVSYWYIKPYDVLFNEELMLMRSTGLHDKNGKEIYEGDVVKWSREDYHSANDTIVSSSGVGAIVWQKEFAMFGFVQTMKYGCLQMQDNVLEVLGNIYEDEYDITERA